MEGKGRGLEGKGAAGGVCACLFGGVLMRSVGRGAVCVGPHDARRRRTCCQDKRWAIKEARGAGLGCWRRHRHRTALGTARCLRVQPSALLRLGAGGAGIQEGLVVA